MRTKLLRKLRHKYSNLYVIIYSDRGEQWELFNYEICWNFVCSAKELSDVQNRLRMKVQDHIIEYLRKKGRDSLSPNKYLW